MICHALQPGSRLPRQIGSWRTMTTKLAALNSSMTPRARPNFTQSHYSTTSPPSVQYGYIEDVEDLRYYVEGGFHPVSINDRLGQRYRIVHKLGHGAYSTAWLALDEKTTNYVAVKVGIAGSERTEIDVLSQLTQGPLSCGIPKGKPSLLPVVLDRFEVRGPNGTHPCLVTVAARCSLRDAREASGSWFFQLDVARSLAAQLVMAVSLVHARGYAHGDLHLGNLFLQLPSSLDNLSIDQLYERYGKPEPEPIVRLDTAAAPTDPGVPPYAVPPVWLGAPCDKITLPEANLILSDFGVAFRPDDRSQFQSFTPLVLRPPEAFFEPETPLTFASDIWSLGCVIFELIAHRSLIDGFLTPQDEITSKQVDLQGPMPPEWWAKWEERPKWYDEAGRALRNERDIWPWERHFEEWVQSPRRHYDMETLKEEELDALSELLRWMLAWRPSERPDVERVLKSDWITRWALPAYQKGLERRLT